MILNLWTSCPFCTRVFDANAEPSVELIVDRNRRHAHTGCIPKEKRVASSDLNLPEVQIAAE